MHNNALLSPGDLLLMDAGGSFGGYSADITRTWPLSGTFTPEQRDVYSAVLSVNEACIAAAKGDGGTSIASLHHLSLRLTHEAGSSSSGSSSEQLLASPSGSRRDTAERKPRSVPRCTSSPPQALVQLGILDASRGSHPLRVPSHTARRE
mmetsp:Transcript_5094/g.16321  ORF Transcript_5094/g.16321 Transcript_5094/m.16321 type:complete len:150 (-) Transcript_5094:419-868(-)